MCVSVRTYDRPPVLGGKQGEVLPEEGHKEGSGKTSVWTKNYTHTHTHR